MSAFRSSTPILLYLLEASTSTTIVDVSKG